MRIDGRTAIAFMDEIRAGGYDAMFYASKGEMEGDAAWDVTQLEAHGKIWVAQYPEKPYPQTKQSSYDGSHAMWQYSDGGHVDGMKTGADVNVAYLRFDAAKAPKDPTPPKKAYPGTDSEMLFSECHERVTAKEVVNLRSLPSTTHESSRILETLSAGEKLKRTGINKELGWSRLEYNGITVYAITSYLENIE